MNLIIFSLLVILIGGSIIPADAQITINKNAIQKSIEVNIDSIGNVHVKHVIKSANSPKQVELIYGTVSNLSVVNELGEENQFSVIGDNVGVLIFPSSSDSIVEYDLEHVLVQKNNVWTWSFRYLEPTSFIFPEEAEFVYANDRPIFLDEKKGIFCHGCQMVLEYAFNEPKNIIDVNWEDKEFFVEMRTFTNIENFEFNQPTKEIRFDVNESNQFITTIIPLELLWGPYVIFLDDEKVQFQDYKNNGTHVWIKMRPDTAGEISIIGTTVVPEFPIAPLAIGFLIIMIMPFVRKFNLH
jgi:hypothetical protein